LRVIAGSASQKLSTRLAKTLGCKLVKSEVKRFPDGELYVRLRGEVRNQHVVVVQSTCTPQDGNLMELFFILNTARDLGAKKITAVVPYLAYARQDKRFKPGEAVSLQTVARLLKAAGADRVITLDIHEEHSLRDFPVPAVNLTAMPLLGEYLKKLKLNCPIVVGGDQGSEIRAKLVAEKLGSSYDYLVKRRVSPTKVITKPKKLDMRGHDAVIVDDIISTGGTIIEAAKILRREGARKIYAACTHGVFSGNALQKLKKAKIQVIATDTIEGPASLVSVASLIARALR